jgi:hypothetical protein
VVASVSTTTNTNDTVKFVGTYEEDESATADTSLTVQAVAEEAELQRFRKLYYYPAIYTSRRTLHVDYVKECSDLSNDTDEPAMPMEDRVILLYGVLHRAWSRERNPEEANRNWQLYSAKLSKMQTKMQDNFDKPKFAPSSRYLNAKKSSPRRRYNEFNTPGVGGSGSSATTITGTPSTAAIYNASGELTSSSTITTTELGYLDGATGNIQGQIDAHLADTTDAHDASAISVSPSGNLAATNVQTALTELQGDIDNAMSNTLADGSVFIGNGSNVATARAVTGDVTISNTGVTAIAAGAIVNADVSGTAAIAYSKLNLATSIVNADVAAAAAIAHSKMAALTASRAMVTDASGFASAATTTSTEIGYVNGVTSAIQTQLDGKFARAMAVATKTGDYTATTSDDFLIFDANGASRTLTLYAASGNAGRVIRVKRVDSTAYAPGNLVTIDANASETIDGATTKKLCTQYEEFTLVCDGTGWHVLDHTYPSAWESFTPTGTWSSNTTYAGKWRRVGDSIEVQTLVSTSGAPTSADLSVNIPNSASWTIDTAKGSFTGLSTILDGVVHVLDGGTALYSGVPVYSSTTAVLLRVHAAGGTFTTTTTINQALPITFGNTDAVGVYYRVPITNFEG